MVDEINEQIKKTKKIARKESIRMMKVITIHTSSLATHAEKRPNKCPAPSSDSNNSSSCGEEAVEGPSVGKGGGKKPKLAKKMKAKKKGERK